MGAPPAASAGRAVAPENFYRTGEFRPLFEHFVRAVKGE
jgi:hypothetical protein